ncbi:hypothetical protein [Natrinema pallidum]|uniref:Uncharacterized protein n=1 Tax=Natrinema pallidum TaxID=69527 RepID=A0A4P9TGD4_9EURY|nr:hypothetical protein [Natrinema pallidum]QCW03777.1 hypothetical protein FGF80_11250 [Natrinema pallidum]
MDAEEQPNNSNESNSDQNNNSNQLRCSFHVELLKDSPEDAPIISANEKELMEVNIIKRIFNIATDKDRDLEKITRPSGKYEQFSVDPNSKEELKEGRNSLESLPRYQNEDYPLGVYVESDGIIAAITEDCLT